MTDPNSTLPLPRLEAALQGRQWLVLLVLLVGAAGVRGIVFAELLQTPMVAAHRFVNTDMQFFDQWATIVAGGDWLSETVGHPVHDWHVEVARSYHLAHSTGLGDLDLLEEPARNAAAKELWDGWYGGKRFHQEPFYPYLLAGLYAAFGIGDPVPMFLLQGLLSIVTLGLLFRLTRRLFGVCAAVVTVVVGSVWVPWIHYDLTLLRASWIVFFGVLLAERADALVSRAGEGSPPGRRSLLLYGVLVGLATTLRSTFLLYGAGLCLWVLLRQGGIGALVRRSWQPVLGAAILLLPVWIRNAMVGAPLFSMTSVGPVTLAGGNLPGVFVTGGWFIQPVAESMMKVMHGNDGMLAMAGSLWDLHGGATPWLRLLFEKFLFIWHWYETPNNTSVYFVRMHSSIFAQLLDLVRVAWILSACLVGILAAVLARRRAGVLWWHFVVALAPMVAFYVLSRFRLPMVVGLLPFLGFGVVQVLSWVLGRQIEKVVGCLGLFVVLLMWMNRALLPERPFLTAHPYVAAAKAYYQPKARAAREAGDHGRVIQIYQQMINTRPAWIDRIGPDRPLRNEVELGMVRYAFLPAYEACLYAARQGQMVAAMEVFRPTVDRFKRALEVGIVQPGKR